MRRSPLRKASWDMLGLGLPVRFEIIGALGAISNGDNGIEVPSACSRTNFLLPLD